MMLRYTMPLPDLGVHLKVKEVLKVGISRLQNPCGLLGSTELQEV
jgi:hypothetical protein